MYSYNHAPYQEYKVNLMDRFPLPVEGSIAGESGHVILKDMDIRLRDIDEIMFQCNSDDHWNSMHFKTNNSNVL